MGRSSNPFTPAFGVVPPCWTGRDEVLGWMMEALEAGSSHPRFTSLLLGARGTGKTVFQRKFRDASVDAGWIVCQVDASPSTDGQSMSCAIAAESMAQLGCLPKSRAKRRELSRLLAGRSRPTQTALFGLHDAAAGHGKEGVVLLVDEFHNLTVGEVAGIASAVQNAKVSDRQIALVAAGLDVMATTLLVNDAFAYFQRCWRLHTGLLEAHDARRVLAEPLAASGIQVDGRLLDRALTAAGGHPFALQSLGHSLWRRSARRRSAGDNDLTRSVADMRRGLDAHIVGPDWGALSSGKQGFLKAMTADRGPASVAGLAERIGASRDSVHALRDRLIRDGLIRPTAHGYVEFPAGPLRDSALEQRLLSEARR